VILYNNIIFFDPFQMCSITIINYNIRKINNSIVSFIFQFWRFRMWSKSLFFVTVTISYTLELRFTSSVPKKSYIRLKHLKLRNKAFWRALLANYFIIFYCYKQYFMQNVQNLYCFLDKSTFFKVTKNIFDKKRRKGGKKLKVWAS